MPPELVEYRACDLMQCMLIGVHAPAVRALALHILGRAVVSHYELHIGERLASLCAKGAKMMVKSKKYLDSQALHERETGSIDVAEVLILISPQDLPGSLLIFGAHSEHLR
jgi:hypothetical protein